MNRAPGILEHALLSQWLFRTAQRTHRKSLLESVAGELYVSVPTLRSGGPTRASAQERVVRRILDRIDSKALEADEIDSAFRARSRERVRRRLSNNFWFAFGNHADPMVRDIAAGIDNLDSDLMHGARSPEEVDSVLCKAAEHPSAFPRPAKIEPAPEHVSMNAMLLMMAAIDHASCWNTWQPTWRPRSLLIGMAPERIDGTPRSPTRRFLDFIYPVALRHSNKIQGKPFPMPESPPTINALEDIFHLHRKDGKRSHVVHWRNGTKNFYLSDLEILLSSAFGEDADSVRQEVFYPYMFSAFWECIQSDAKEHLDWAKRRASQWWSIVSTRDQSDGISGQPYWDMI